MVSLPATIPAVRRSYSYYGPSGPGSAGDPSDRLARGLLEKAVDAYLTEFEADWRDPRINAVTLMELHEPPDPRRQLIPIVSYAVGLRLASCRGRLLRLRHPRGACSAR